MDHHGDTYQSCNYGLPLCTTLSVPVNGAINVPVSTNLTWNAAATATGYILSIGTTPGGTNILNNEDIGNVTSYNPPANLPSNTTVYMKIIPYNANGSATGCLEESFTMESFSLNDFVTTWKTDNPGSSNSTSITILPPEPATTTMWTGTMTAYMTNWV
ncbi:MAG: hypothetical protein IPH94_19505 [Saprospiraceae bacterium]|nr:hypothetical protein [Saprospiraceae bacterium]